MKYLSNTLGLALASLLIACGDDRSNPARSSNTSNQQTSSS